MSSIYMSSLIYLNQFNSNQIINSIKKSMVLSLKSNTKSGKIYCILKTNPFSVNVKMLRVITFNKA